MESEGEEFDPAPGTATVLGGENGKIHQSIVTIRGRVADKEPQGGKHRRKRAALTAPIEPEFSCGVFN